MSIAQSNSKRSAADKLAVLGRVFMGGLFLYMGLSKALDPVEFLKLVRQYDLVSTPWMLNSIAATLPWFEAFCGLLLIAGVAVRGTAVMLLAMLVPFTIVVFQRALALQAELQISFCQVQFDCGCGAGIVYICPKLLENLGLMMLAVWLLAGWGRHLAMRFNLLK
jgi:uncharacterized membrane protein YphA (DoxX/SURF4 family)